LVLFVGALSYIFLNRKLYLYQWVSLFVVMGGVSLVGLSGSMIKDAVKESQPPLGSFDAPSAPEPVDAPQATKVLLGIFFVLFAQVL
jgi:drug/metabolite transporter (DMT)-like permease